MSTGTVRGMPRALLRLEGACILAVAAWAYARLGSPGGCSSRSSCPGPERVGLRDRCRGRCGLSNAVHTLTPPLLVLGGAVALGATAGAGLMLFRLARIGLDRALG
jgi:hypothetical protein